MAKKRRRDAMRDVTRRRELTRLKRFKPCLDNVFDTMTGLRADKALTHGQENIIKIKGGC